jgi:DNA-binding transcriptional ArsR family regulator
LTDGQDENLAHCLVALASPTRLAIMRALRSPKTLGEIKVRANPNGDMGAPLARQTIQRHLAQLIEAGIVIRRETDRDYGPTSEFVVNHQRIFTISEQVHQLARLRPVIELDTETRLRAQGSSPKREGPTLVLVKGLDEGTLFNLRPRQEDSAWTIGRSRSADVPLDFDPTVSHQNARVRFREGRYFLEDVPGSTNGTTWNLRRLAAGESPPLRHGDLIGVGQSILLFWE